MKIATYVLTYNSTAQLKALLRSFSLHEPKFLQNTIVVDQSTIPARARDNAEVCRTQALEYRAFKNSGASGGRFLCAELFAASDFDAMFFFEDDMTLTHDKRARCRFGFPNYVDKLYDLSTEVLTSEQLGYLKLTFHEVFNDHSVNFPFNRPASFSKLSSKNDIGYLLGEIYYSNWPMLITKAASQLLFAAPRVSEGALMLRAAEAMTQQRLKAGVLGAWPIRHNRVEATAKIDLA